MDDLNSIVAPGRGTVDAQVTARQEEAARLEREREAAALQTARDRLAAYEGETHQRFLHNGGTSSDFARAWPALKEAWLIEQSAADPDQRRADELYEKMKATGARSI